MSRRIYVFILSNLLFTSLWAQNAVSDPATEEAAKTETEQKDRKDSFFEGISLGFDIANPLMGLLGSDAMGTEAALRLNIRNKYFPVVELGYSRYDGTNDETSLHYKTAAPYLRAGVDFNILKNKKQPNRLYVGLRLAYSTFSFDVDGPDIVDPIWGTTAPYSISGIKSDRVWGEIVFGLEAEVFHNLHMGFALRYKSKLSGTTPECGGPYYIPGFGTGDSNTFGATYNITFDLTRKDKKKENLNKTKPNNGK